MTAAFHNIPPSFGYLQNQVVQYASFIRVNPMQGCPALTTPFGFNAWFISVASVQSVNDGQIRFLWVNCEPEHIAAENGALVPQAVAWKCFFGQCHPNSPDFATTLEINLAFKDGGTIVSLCEHGFAASTSGLQAMVDCAAGWGEAFTLRKFYLEYGLYCE